MYVSDQEIRLTAQIAKVLCPHVRARHADES